MKSFLSRNRIKIFLAAIGALLLYGFFLSKQSEETKDIVYSGVKAKDAKIDSLSQAKKTSEIKAEKAVQQVEKVKNQVADSTAVVIQKKQEVIDSLTKKKPNEVLIADPDDPTTVASDLANYKPDTVRLENGAPVY
jgi:Cys-tRNA synthase (O-phospho-L-seryl-tRNA:Cys-tRNA synthase)